MSNRESVGKTLLVALLLCIACSVVVAGAAVSLKPMQQANKLLDRNKNILSAAGLFDSKKHSNADVDGLFAQFTARMVDLQEGRFLTDAEVSDLGLNPEAYEQRKAAKNPDLSKALVGGEDLAGIGRRARYATVYTVEENGQINRLVLPVHGYGLWGTLYGFLSLEGDANTVAGLGFYEHKETPGLGAEVDNPKWKQQWIGKRVLDNAGKVAVGVKKGKVDPNSDEADYMVDGLSGATLTSRGVDNLMQYWLGDDGFGPFLAGLRGGKS